MKLPTGSDAPAHPRADDDIAALLAAADARIQQRKTGGELSPPPPVVVDLAAELRRPWLWVRPWRSTAVAPPDLERAEPLGPLPGCSRKASAWCSRPGDPTGPWWALRLDAGDDLDSETLARCWRVWWRSQLPLFTDLDDLMADAGDSPAAQAWLGLTWEEAVRLGGRVSLFPAPGHRDENHVRTMAKGLLGLGYVNAWLRAQGAPKRQPKVTTLEANQRHASLAVASARQALDFARKDLAHARSERGRARVRLAQAKANDVVGTTLAALGLRRALEVEAQQKAITLAEAAVIEAKRHYREADEALKAEQDKLATATAALEKAVRARLEEAQAAAPPPAA
ncbi:hypothetical protein O0J72_17675 [Stenotrophomonas sp. Sm3212]|uniref:hypothetical protein n=1 Tax=Stenotrophomonas sp. Sm3212 TaxID=3002748 RepID=UPI0027E491F2|nr:hypothetical protein [Stenotrophomonas sp. Sm3212]MDQ7273955.1 hypothetical protein [Stenotrophomonas sp. Sm3212]